MEWEMLWTRTNQHWKSRRRTSVWKAREGRESSFKLVISSGAAVVTKTAIDGASMCCSCALSLTLFLKGFQLRMKLSFTNTRPSLTFWQMITLDYFFFFKYCCWSYSIWTSLYLSHDTTLQKVRQCTTHLTLPSGEVHSKFKFLEVNILIRI